MKLRCVDGFGDTWYNQQQTTYETTNFLSFESVWSRWGINILQSHPSFPRAVDVKLGPLVLELSRPSRRYLNAKSGKRLTPALTLLLPALSSRQSHVLHRPETRCRRERHRSQHKCRAPAEHVSLTTANTKAGTTRNPILWAF